MALSTEGSKFIGVVVQNGVCGGDRDPLGIQRVKVLVPGLHHPNQNKDDSPWCIVLLDNNGVTRNTILRQGQFVNVEYEPGTKSSGNPGKIVGLYNGVHTPNDKPPEGYNQSNPAQNGGELFSQRGFVMAAKGSVPVRESFAAINTQTQGSMKSDSGVAPITSRVTYIPATSMENISGLPIDYGSKMFIQTSKGIYSIYTASAWSALAYDTGSGGTGNPDPTPSSNMHPIYTAELGELIRDPVLKKGFENLVNNLFPKFYTQTKTLHFSNEPNRVSDEWKIRVKKELARASSMVDLMDIIFKIQTQSYYESTTIINTKTIQAETPFGTVNITVQGSGEYISADVGGVASGKANFITGLMNKVPTAASLKEGGEVEKEDNFGDTDRSVNRIKFAGKGGLFEGSLVAGDGLLRLPSSKAKSVRESIRKFSEAGFKDLIFAFSRFAANEGNYKAEADKTKINGSSKDLGAVAAAWK